MSAGGYYGETDLDESGGDAQPEGAMRLTLRLDLRRAGDDDVGVIANVPIADGELTPCDDDLDPLDDLAHHLCAAAETWLRVSRAVAAEMAVELDEDARLDAVARATAETLALAKMQLIQRAGSARAPAGDADNAAHLGTDDLAEYDSGRLVPTLARTVERHLSNCALCAHSARRGRLPNGLIETLMGEGAMA